MVFVSLVATLAWRTPIPAQEKDAPEIVVLDLGGGVKMEFVRIQAGKFTMGDKDFKNATPHEVTLTKDFWMQTTETTQAQWEAVMGKNPSELKGADLPVEMVSWNDCQEFLKKLTERAKEQWKGKKAGLPTEAEWEYACRAGEKGKWCFGDDEKKLGEYAWFRDNAEKSTHPVAQKKANAWGLYDMHGNVREWCKDWYGTYEKDAGTDPTGPVKGEYCVFRGGSWNSNARGASSAYRIEMSPAYCDRGGGVRPVLR